MKHLMIDIEALGKKPGCAIFELAAVVFDLETGETGSEFRAAIQPDCGTVEKETVDWHKARGTFPMPGTEERETAMVALDRFAAWYGDQGSPGTIWSWGSTYDFPVLQAVWRSDATAPFPWRYHRACCARTVWKLAFPDVRHAERPHKALEDCHAAIADLVKANRALRGQYDAVQLVPFPMKARLNRAIQIRHSENTATGLARAALADPSHPEFAGMRKAIMDSLSAGLCLCDLAGIKPEEVVSEWVEKMEAHHGLGKEGQPG